MDFKKVVEKLIKLGKTIATMESCTGGGVSNAITNIENASKVLKFSAVTYSNEFKIKMGVNKEVIAKYSVYSMEVAREMGKQISLFTESDFGVGITGKLNKVDENNLYGEDNIVYISIYDKKLDKYYDKQVRVTLKSREGNKNIVINKVCELLGEII